MCTNKDYSHNRFITFNHTKIPPTSECRGDFFKLGCECIPHIVEPCILQGFKCPSLRGVVTLISHHISNSDCICAINSERKTVRCAIFKRKLTVSLDFFKQPIFPSFWSHPKIL